LHSCRLAQQGVINLGRQQSRIRQNWCNLQQVRVKKSCTNLAGKYQPDFELSGTGSWSQMCAAFLCSPLKQQPGCTRAVPYPVAWPSTEQEPTLARQFLQAVLLGILSNSKRRNWHMPVPLTTHCHGLVLADAFSERLPHPHIVDCCCDSLANALAVKTVEKVLGTRLEHQTGFGWGSEGEEGLVQKTHFSSAESWSTYLTFLF